MEKLQPLIKHRFWIILGAVLLLTIAGWWISTSAKAAYIQQRWDKLSGLSVPSGSGTPNDTYIKGIDGVIQVLDKNQNELDNRLYESQKSLHTWPPYVAQRVEGKKFGDPIPFNVRSVYATYYMREIEQMLADLPHYQWDPRTNAETGLVEVYPENIPMGPVDKWKDVPPVSKVIWETQEDVWLTRSILEAIKNVNMDAGATKISDAPVRVIDKLELRGGSRSTGTGEGGGGGMPGGDMADTFAPSFGGHAEEMPAGEYDGMGGGGGGSSITFKATITLNPDSVLGPQTMQATGTGEGGDAMAAPGPMGGGASQALRRYVDDDPTLPYKTRGFVLEVVMLHEKLPDLQAALVSMPWPTELLLIHQVSDRDDDLAPVEKPNQSRRPMRPGMNSQFGEQGRMTGGPRRNPFAARRQFGTNRSGRNPFGGNRFGNPMGFPMGAGEEFNSDMFPGGGVEGMGPGYGQDQSGDNSSYAKAMKDFSLAKVGIVGLMTIYRSPEEQAAEAAEAGAPAPAPETPAAPSTGETAEPGAEPAEPGAEPVEPGTEPVPPGTEPKIDTPAEPGLEPQPAPPADNSPASPEGATENPAPTPKTPETVPSKNPAAGEPAPPAGNPPNPNPSPPDGSTPKAN